MSRFNILILLLATASLKGCTPLVGPIYDWSHPSFTASQMTIDDTECREVSLARAGNRPRNANIAGDVSKGSDFETRDYNRRATTSWTRRFDRAMQRCMSKLGYVDPRSVKRLPSELMSEFEGNKSLLVLVDQSAMLAYAQQYKTENTHKAFAASISGAWAWVAKRDNSNAAQQDALSTCADYNQGSEQFPCEVLNLNGEWVDFETQK